MGCLVGWMGGWLFVRLNDWFVRCMADMLLEWLIGCLFWLLVCLVDSLFG